ncbi:hypothetical protein TNCV_2871521 [Trichonephila clavipes]|nr:hypothetical protein TNCV_2871521 [Trichonephila clavipes]
MELPTGPATIMGYAQSVSLFLFTILPPSQLSHCDWLQLCNADIRKHTIMHTGVHTFRLPAPCTDEEAPEMKNWIHKTYLQQRFDAVVSEFKTLTHWNTSGCPDTSNSL